MYKSETGCQSESKLKKKKEKDNFKNAKTKQNQATKMSVLFAEMDPSNVQNQMNVCGQKNQKPPQSTQLQQLPSPTSSSSAAALQLALELSMLSLSSCNNNVGNDMMVNMGNDHQQQQQHQANMKSCR